MAKAEMKIGEQSKPRFEFRAFGQQFDEQIKKMDELSKVERIRDIYEVYLMTVGNTKNNIKIRNKMMDIKVLLDEKAGLELWEPYMVGEFPMKTEILTSEVFPALGVEAPFFDRDKYTLEQFLKEIIKPDPDIVAVFTEKKRFAYTINKCICEVAEVLINGALIKTIAIESENVDDVIATKALLGFTEQIENVSYPLELRRVTGLASRTDEHLQLIKN